MLVPSRGTGTVSSAPSGVHSPSSCSPSAAAIPAHAAGRVSSNGSAAWHGRNLQHRQTDNIVVGEHDFPVVNTPQHTGHWDGSALNFYPPGHGQYHQGTGQNAHIPDAHSQYCESSASSLPRHKRQSHEHACLPGSRLLTILPTALPSPPLSDAMSSGSEHDGPPSAAAYHHAQLHPHQLQLLSQSTPNLLSPDYLLGRAGRQLLLRPSSYHPGLYTQSAPQTPLKPQSSGHGYHGAPDFTSFTSSTSLVQEPCTPNTPHGLLNGAPTSAYSLRMASEQGGIDTMKARHYSVPHTIHSRLASPRLVHQRTASHSMETIHAPVPVRRSASSDLLSAKALELEAEQRYLRFQRGDAVLPPDIPIRRDSTASAPPQREPSPAAAVRFSSEPFPGLDGDEDGMQVDRPASALPFTSSFTSKEDPSSMDGDAPEAAEAEDSIWSASADPPGSTPLLSPNASFSSRVSPARLTHQRRSSVPSATTTSSPSVPTLHPTTASASPLHCHPSLSPEQALRRMRSTPNGKRDLASQLERPDPGGPVRLQITATRRDIS